MEQQKVTKMYENWKQTGSGNSILRGDGFFISYNGSVGATTGIAMFASDGDEPETAIVKGNHFLILNGDFRTEYEELIPKGYDACVEFFKQHKDVKSSWSNDLPTDDARQLGVGGE